MEQTTLSEIRGYADGVLVELPSFGDGKPFIARVKRPSLMCLISEGYIPNELKGKAVELFTEEKTMNELITSDEVADTYEVFRLIAKSSLCSPTLEEIENTGLTLTDEQLIALFNYSQGGIRALSPFRTE